MHDAQIQMLADAIAGADAVLIGAGAGLSSAAGFSYAGPRFEQAFPDFIARYRFPDMYGGGFYPFPSPEEFWAYWSRYIWINRYRDPPGPVYQDLLALVREKAYFVLTTNVDHCFQRAGFDKSRLFYTQGDYGLWQCAAPCHEKTYDNEGAVRRMVGEQKNMRVPSGLAPRCPRCGGPMTMNLRCDDSFVQDEGWYAARNRYLAFLRRYAGAHVLFWELGVGGNTPGIIRYPFQRMTEQNPRAVYARVNLEAAWQPPGLTGRSICILGDLGRTLALLRKELKA